jgi:ornithine--oxo-acid transaminase
MKQDSSLYAEYVSKYRCDAIASWGYDITWSKGENQYLFDSTGKRYLDLCGGFSVFSLGRNNPYLCQVLIETLNSSPVSLVQFDCPPLAGELAAELIKLAPPPLKRVAFCNSGAEAIEIALKFARKATGRKTVVHCAGSFHGLTTGALSINGDDPAFRGGFGELFPSIAVEINDLQALEAALSSRQIAAFVVEPIQGKGMAIASDEFLRGAQKLCNDTGTLLIVDEIQTGLGRTGSMFAIERAGIGPDMLVVSKALSGGFIPVGACLHSQAVHEKVFNPETWWVQSSTFKENTLAMKVGLAALKELQEKQFPKRAEELGRYFIAGIEKLIPKHRRIQKVCGRGLMLGVVLDGTFGEVVNRVIFPLVHRHNMYLQPAPWVKITPALTITPSDIDDFCIALDAVLSEWQE